MILLAEGHHDTLALYEFCFTSDGFSVISIPRGDLAGSVLARQAIDGAVIDIALPGLDGFGLAALIRQTQRRPVPIIAVTGLSVSSLAAKTQVAGIDALLAKPCDPERIVRKMRELLEERPTG